MFHVELYRGQVVTVCGGGGEECILLHKECCFALLLQGGLIHSIVKYKQNNRY
jgi:hypothetical protein